MSWGVAPSNTHHCIRSEQSGRQVLAKAVHFINHERLPAMIKEAQDVLRKREGMLQ